MKKKKFYVMMEKLENYHLIKDVGMIPYMLYKSNYYDSYVISYASKRDEFPYLDNEVKGLRYIQRNSYIGNSLVDGCIWLIRHAKEIDILNLYHYKPSTFLWSMVYKLFNSYGQVYVKLDIDSNDGINMSMSKGTIKYWLTERVLGKCKVVSCETAFFADYTNENWPIDISYIPNGIEKKEIMMCEEKEKIILSVGRLGTQQKATENILQAFISSLPYIDEEWKLVLIGTAEKEFYEELEKISQDNPTGYERICYMGEITNRKELNEIYKKAAIFTMASRGESFGLVVLEALAKSDYLLATDLISFRELCCNEKFGKLIPVDDIDRYASSIVDLCNAMQARDLNFNKYNLQQYLKERFCYESIVKKLYDLIESE